MYLMKGKNIY